MFHGSRVELAEVLDVPWVWHQCAIFFLEPCRAWPCDVSDPEGAFPHRRELVEPCPGEDSAEDKVTNLERARADVAAVVAAESLLVARSMKGSLATRVLEEEKTLRVDFPLAGLVKGQDPWRSVLDFIGEDHLSPVDEEERCLLDGLGWHCAD